MWSVGSCSLVALWCVLFLVYGVCWSFVVCCVGFVGICVLFGVCVCDVVDVRSVWRVVCRAVRVVWRSARCSSCVVCCWLMYVVVCCLRCVVCCVVFIIGCCSLVVVFGIVSVACCLSYVVRCVLLVARCWLRVLCCWTFVDVVG